MEKSYHLGSRQQQLQILPAEAEWVPRLRTFGLMKRSSVEGESHRSGMVAIPSSGYKGLAGVEGRASPAVGFAAGTCQAQSHPDPVPSIEEIARKQEEKAAGREAKRLRRESTP
jgi:hypothetical protein